MMQDKQGAGYTIRRGSIGQAVVTLQERLNALEGRAVVAVDGVFGPETEAGLKKFQEESGMPPSGVADRGAWEALMKKRKRKAN